MCDIVNKQLFGIVDKLKPHNLKVKEIQLCILILIGLPTSQIEEMLPYAHSGIGKFKYSTAKK